LLEADRGSCGRIARKDRCPLRSDAIALPAV